MKELLYTLFCVLTAMVGWHIHHSVVYTILNFFFAPISWIVWLFGHDVTLSVIRETFSWFFK